ncbi:MAG: hypothetical protein U5J64_12700 [Halobacteriales archaeon]|nr:hypothetical protein [Halobacteriales archaeon]
MEETVAGLLQRAPNDGVALAVETKEYKEETFYTTCHKTANLLNHLGVREGGEFVVSTAPEPENVFGFLGACLVGAATRFADGGSVEADALVCGGAHLDAYDVPASCSVLAHGDASQQTNATNFEREIWGENPVFPPDLVAESDAVVLAESELTTSELVEEARAVVEERGLWNGDELRVGRLDDENAVKVVAALVARATVVLGDVSG